VEYLLGRLMRNNLIATGLLDTAHEAMQQIGLNLDTIIGEEHDAGLGTGGLGRLAACFLDSLATLDYPAYGYGLRYDYGMFRQNFDDGWQVEHSDDWLAEGNAWEVERSDLAVPVMIGGHIEWDRDELGGHHPRWAGQRTFDGVPYDMLVAGHDTLTVDSATVDRGRTAGFDFRSSPRATTSRPWPSGIGSSR
jgi:starch phosphorylase